MPYALKLVTDSDAYGDGDAKAAASLWERRCVGRGPECGLGGGVGARWDTERWRSGSGKAKRAASGSYALTARGRGGTAGGPRREASGGYGKEAWA